MQRKGKNYSRKKARWGGGDREKKEGNIHGQASSAAGISTWAAPGKRKGDTPYENIAPEKRCHLVVSRKRKTTGASKTNSRRINQL